MKFLNKEKRKTNCSQDGYAEKLKDQARSVKFRADRQLLLQQALSLGEDCDKPDRQGQAQPYSGKREGAL